MTYEVYICCKGARQTTFDWVPLPVNFVDRYDWANTKDYAVQSGLPVREKDASGLVTREFYPAIADDV